MNPEYGIATRNLHVSIFEAKCIVVGSRLLLTGFDFLTKLRRCQVGHSGDGQCGGNYTRGDVDESV